MSFERLLCSYWSLWCEHLIKKWVKHIDDESWRRQIWFKQWLDWKRASRMVWFFVETYVSLFESRHQRSLLNATGRNDISSPGLSSLWRIIKSKNDRKPERSLLSHLVPLIQTTDLFFSFVLTFMSRFSINTGDDEDFWSQNSPNGFHTNDE